MPDFLWPHGLSRACLLCPWDFPGMNTGVGCHFLLPGIFLIQGLKPCLLFGKEILYHWATWEAHEQRLGIAITVISVAGIPWKHCHLPKDSLIRLHNPDVIKCCLGNYLLFKLYFYLKKFFFNFNWRVITLQYCGGFCHTLTWISYGCTLAPPSWAPLSPPSPPHSFGLS